MQLDQINYKRRFCWDTMMGSSEAWKQGRQSLAETEGVPVDVIYKGHDREWVRYGEVENDHTRRVMRSSCNVSLVPKLDGRRRSHR